MRHAFLITSLLISGLCVAFSAEASRPPSEAATSEERLVTVTIEVRFETEEVNIPGWEGGLFSEPVGEGSVELRLVFASGGGDPIMQSGEAELDRYGCRGSAPCSCSIPVQVIDKVWEPVLLERIKLDDASDTLLLMGPVQYPDDETSVSIRCSGAPPTVVPDHPLFKLLGSFTEANDARWDSMFVVPLAPDGTGHQVFARELYSQGPKVFRARIEISVVPKAPEPTE